MCWLTWAAYKWPQKKKHAPFYLHTHTPIYTECIFRCPSGCARRQFYVVGDLRLWSRCLGSDNIMTESTGVTTYRQEGHTHTQIDARTDTYCVSYWMARLFVHWPKGSNVIPQEIILTLDTMCIQLWTNEINFKLKLAKGMDVFHHVQPTQSKPLYKYASVQYKQCKHN